VLALSGALNDLVAFLPRLLGALLILLVGQGIPEREARYFEAGFRAGGVLVTVNAGPRAGEALSVLERPGADTGAGAA
jgi:Conserved TM helix